MKTDCDPLVTEDLLGFKIKDQIETNCCMSCHLSWPTVFYTTYSRQPKQKTALSPFLDKASNDAESIMDRSVSLLQDKLVGSADQHGHSLARVSDACGLHNT